MKCIAIDLLTEVRDSLRDLNAHLANLDTLEEKRRNDRERKRRVRGHEICPRTKEDEKGKEGISPHTPFKEEKGKGEERKNKTCAHASFVPPTIEEVTAYCRERHNNVDPILWWNFYDAKGWLFGSTKMVNWKHAIISWERHAVKGSKSKAYADPKVAAFEAQQEENRRRIADADAFIAKLMAKRTLA